MINDAQERVFAHMAPQLTPQWRKVHVMDRMRLEKRVLQYEALFHGWGFEREDEETGYTIAVVEKEDGTVRIVAAELIVFLDRHQAFGHPTAVPDTDPDVGST